MDGVKLRDLENESIRAFVENNKKLLSGNVLDFGAGKQPFRKIVEEAGGVYHPFDRMMFPASTVTTDVGSDEAVARLNTWDAILCTQVIQYLPDPMVMLRDFEWALKPGGALVITGPTNWPVVETQDLHRFTVPGIRSMLERALFHVRDVRVRAHVSFEGEEWPLGWAAVALA